VPYAKRTTLRMEDTKAEIERTLTKYGADRVKKWRGRSRSALQTGIRTGSTANLSMRAMDQLGGVRSRILREHQRVSTPDRNRATNRLRST
jgi:hypothetical protein